MPTPRQLGEGKRCIALTGWYEGKETCGCASPGACKLHPSLKAALSRNPLILKEKDKTFDEMLLRLGMKIVFTGTEDECMKFLRENRSSKTFRQMQKIGTNVWAHTD